MIPNPGAYLKQYIRRHFPGIDIAATKIVEIGSSAHVDVWLPSIRPVPRIRLMLPHTAPADAKPLLAEVSVGKQSMWEHRDDPQFYHGIRVHLYEVANMYFMLYVKPDRDREWLMHINALEDLLRERPILSQEMELVARVIAAEKLGYHVELNRMQRGKVRHIKQKFARGD